MELISTNSWCGAKRASVKTIADASPNRLLHILIGCFVLSLGGWGCGSDRAHEYFKQAMGSQIGKTVNDPSFYGNRYPEMRISIAELANGNFEEHLQMGIGWRCQVFFEIDRISQKIVAWRYEGTKDVCAHSR